MTTADFKAKVFNYDNANEWAFSGDKPAVIDFYADWCGPCKAIGPVIDELAAEFEGKVIIAKMNVDDNPATPGTFSVPASSRSGRTSGMAWSRDWLPVPP